MLSRVWAIRGRLFGSPSVVFARCPHRRAGQRLDVVPASLGRQKERVLLGSWSWALRSRPRSRGGRLLGARPCIETLRCGVGEGRDGSGARGAASSQGGFRRGIGMGVLACGLHAAFGPARASNGDGCNNGMRLALWLDSAAAWRQ